MRRVLATLVLLIASAEAVIIFALVERSQVSTLEIDRDRATVRAQITDAENEAAQYSGGALKTLIEVRAATLRNTLAMLDQKRASLIRIIALTYTIEGRAAQEASDKELNDILGDLSESERTIASAKAEAARYTGGLVQTMQLMKAATEEITLASLRMKFYSAKHGFPMPIPSLETTKTPPPKPPGKIVKDREAL